MLTEKYISQSEYEEAINAQLPLNFMGPEIEVYAPYISEMVRENGGRYGHERAYNTGFKVYTSVESNIQQAAQDALVDLHAYDMRHGYRGATTLG